MNVCHIMPQDRQGRCVGSTVPSYVFIDKFNDNLIISLIPFCFKLINYLAAAFVTGTWLSATVHVAKTSVPVQMILVCLLAVNLSFTHLATIILKKVCGILNRQVLIHRYTTIEGRR